MRILCVAGADHPRIRGEHRPVQPRSRSRAGSSPYTRGALACGQGISSLTGIIPAYAGSTSASTASDSSISDHPRIRGEHPHHVVGAEIEPGSSPHTRGAPERAGGSPAAQGIIPAYAGSTTGAPRCARPQADHPRIRGEHSRLLTCLLILEGSSPHTRGAQQPRHEEELVPRIIPAYAGSTTTSRNGCCFSPDHPRIRGEHDPCPLADWATVGSSPHTRGALGDTGGGGRR